MKGRATLLVVIAVLTALRLVAVAFEHPSPEEAYYYLCSQQPAAAYFDGPPGTAWQVGVLAKMGGPDFIWRMVAPLWALAATLACFTLVRRLADERLALLTALILNMLPAFNASALRVGPVLPALTFVFLAIAFAWMAFEAERRAHLWWIAGGLMVGCAALFHYAAVVIVPAVWLFVFCSPKHREFRDFLGLFLFAALPGTMLIPALRWNAAEDWLPIAGGTLQTLWSFDLVGFGYSLIWSLYFISPLVLGGMLVTWVAAGRVMGVRVRARYVFLLAMPGVLVGVYFLMRGMDALFYFLLAVPLLVYKALDLGAPKWMIRLAAALAIALAIPATIVSFTQGRLWATAAADVRALFLEKLAEGQDSLFLIGNDAQTASILGYYFRNDLIPPPGHPSVYVRESQAVTSQFGLWKGYDDFVESAKVGDEYFTEQKGENPFVGRNALYITTESANDFPQSIKAAFESVVLLKTLSLGGDSEEPLYIFLCVNYQTLPL